MKTNTTRRVLFATLITPAGITGGLPRARRADLDPLSWLSRILCGSRGERHTTAQGSGARPGVIHAKCGRAAYMDTVTTPARAQGSGAPVSHRRAISAAAEPGISSERRIRDSGRGAQRGSTRTAIPCEIARHSLARINSPSSEIPLSRLVAASRVSVVAKAAESSSPRADRRRRRRPQQGRSSPRSISAWERD
jgi:hypothetical protein